LYNFIKQPEIEEHGQSKYKERTEQFKQYIYFIDTVTNNNGISQPEMQGLSLGLTTFCANL